MHKIGWARCALLLGILAVLPGATCVPQIVVPDTGGTGGDTSGRAPSGYAAEVIDLVNAERAAYGLKPLVPDDRLAQAALDYAERMAELGFFDHTDPYNGSELWDRAMQAGYSFSTIAENLSAGQPTPEAVMAGWMDSPGHRANILRPEVSEIGVGVYFGGAYGIYWVQMFGEPW